MADNLKVEKEKFDAILGKLVNSKPVPKKAIKASRKKKLGKVLSK